MNLIVCYIQSHRSHCVGPETRYMINEINVEMLYFTVCVLPSLTIQRCVTESEFSAHLTAAPATGHDPEPVLTNSDPHNPSQCYPPVAFSVF